MIEVSRARISALIYTLTHNPVAFFAEHIRERERERERERD